MWNPDVAAFEPLPNARFAGLTNAAQAWFLGQRRILQPSLNGPVALSRLVEAARQANVLVPGSAFMVVENTAQWKMLERSEKKALGGHDAMTLTEKPAEAVPEPTTIALLAIAALVIAARKWRQRRIVLSRTANSAS